MPTQSKRPDTIVLVHGFWVTPRAWEHWIPRYEARGYRVLAPAYPGLEVEVEALNRDPSPVERLTVAAIMAHLDGVVGRLEAPPILMGHSAGGAFVQLLLDRGHGAVGVAINSAPTEGVRVTPLSLTAWQMLCGALALVLVALVVPERPIDWSPAFVAALAYNAVLASGLAWLLWAYIVQRLPAGVAGMTSLAIPVCGVLFAWALLGERPSAIEGVGIALVAVALHGITRAR